MAKKEGKNGVHSRNDGNAIAPAAYFLSLTVQNLRCFGAEPQTLDMSDGNGGPSQWTILLGNNGTGKTTLLEVLVPSFLLDWHTGWYTRNVLRATRATASIRASLVRGTTTTAGLRDSFRKEQHLIEVKEQVAHYGSGCSHTPSPHLTNLKFFSYGATRRLGRSLLSDSEATKAAANPFSDDASLQNAEEWLLRLDYSASKASEVKERQSVRLKQIKALLLEVLPDVEDLRFTMSEGVNPSATVEFNTPYGWVPLRQLGHGYRTMIAWVVDFASRMVETYPNAENPLAQPAVVLVDEIDLHLHPKWQRELMEYLTRLFPNTQFIVTAHSPLIVQAAGPDTRIALLRREGDHVVIDNSMTPIPGWRIDQVLTSDFFGLKSARPPQIEGLLEQRRALLTKPKLTTADKRRLAELESEIGELPAGETAEQAKALALLAESVKRLEKGRSENP
jgi:predicted ATPase